MAEIYRLALTLPMLIRADSADEARRQIENMSLKDLIYEVEDGTEIIAGASAVTSVEHVPAPDVERELLAVGNDGTFFEDMDYMGDDHDQGEGKDQD